MNRSSLVRVDPRHASKTTISNRRTTFGQCDLLRITPPFPKQFHGCRRFRKVCIGREEDEDAFGGSFIVSEENGTMRLAYGKACCLALEPPACLVVVVGLFFWHMAAESKRAIKKPFATVLVLRLPLHKCMGLLSSRIEIVYG